MTEAVVTTAAIRCAKLQIVTTNKQKAICLFTGRMPFPGCPTNSVGALKEKLQS